jgi:hypothetical protein
MRQRFSYSSLSAAPRARSAGCSLECRPVGGLSVPIFLRRIDRESPKIRAEPGHRATYIGSVRSTNRSHFRRRIRGAGIPEQPYRDSHAEPAVITYLHR